MLVTIQEVKNYSRIDTDEDDALITDLIEQATTYLKNATGKDYPETDADGNIIKYSLEKLYLNKLIAYWYEHRDATANAASYSGGVSEAFTFATRSMMLQLQLTD